MSLHAVRLPTVTSPGLYQPRSQGIPWCSSPHAFLISRIIFFSRFPFLLRLPPKSFFLAHLLSKTLQAPIKTIYMQKYKTWSATSSMALSCLSTGEFRTKLWLCSGVIKFITRLYGQQPASRRLVVLESSEADPFTPTHIYTELPVVC